MSFTLPDTCVSAPTIASGRPDPSPPSVTNP